MRITFPAFRFRSGGAPLFFQIPDVFRCDLRKVVDQDVVIGQVFAAEGRSDGDDRFSGAAGGPDAYRGVFDHDAFAGSVLF